MSHTYSADEMSAMLKSWRPPDAPLEDRGSLAAPSGSGELVEVGEELRRMASVLGNTLEGKVCELAADIVAQSGKQAVALNALRGALVFIADFGGKGIDSECGRINCSGSWCAEQAEAALSQNAPHELPGEKNQHA